MKNIKVVFMGTPDFSVPVLKMLIKSCDVIGVVTQPDKPIGRKGKMNISPVKALALENNIQLFQPINIKKEYDDIIQMHPDIIITCAYGQIIPKELLDYPKFGCINVHASLLPKYRGGAPIHHAIINGDSKTGITIMYMDVGMDSGDIIAQKEIPILDNDTTETMFDKLAILGGNLLIETLPKIINHEVVRIKQKEEDVSYAYNIETKDEVIDFNKTRKDVYNQIRGLNSWPIAYTFFEGKRLKVWEAKIGEKKDLTGSIGEIINVYKDGIGIKVLDGEIILTVIQPEGKKKMDVSSYLNGLTDKKKIIGKKMG